MIVFGTPRSAPQTASQWDFCQILPLTSLCPTCLIQVPHSHSSGFWFLFLLPLPSQWHGELGCFVLCVSSRIAAGSHLRTFIRKMMYEAEGTQLDFQSPDWGWCWSSWRRFWHANFAWFWYKGEWWMINTVSHHIHFTLCRLSPTLIRAPRGRNQTGTVTVSSVSTNSWAAGIPVVVLTVAEKGAIRWNNVKYPHERKHLNQTLGEKHP